MDTKVTVTVDKGASHGVKATRVATTTGSEYESRDIEAGKEEVFTLGAEQRIDITAGPETPAEEETSTRAKK